MSVPRRLSEKPLALEVAQAVGFERRDAAFAHARFLDDEILDLREEPGIDVRELFDALARPAGAERVRDVQQAVRPRRAQLVGELVAIFFGERRSLNCSLSPSRPVSRPRSAFCSDSWKVRPMAITSPTDFICVVRRELAAGNFSNVKRGILVTT